MVSDIRDKPIITYDKMLIPVLRALQNLGGSANIDELNTEVKKIMRLPTEMTEVLHKEGGSLTEVDYRLAWARTYLKKCELIGNSSRGIWAFTEQFDGHIDTLNADEIVKHVRSQSKSTVSEQKLTDDDLENDGVDLPEDIYSWRDTLRSVLQSIPSDAFERLTLRLLRESGFTQVEVTGKSNDHGIDGKGIIRLNGLMSFHMIFQCKRYKGSVSPSEIRDFRGAMQGRADKGLFITTGTFTAEAKKEAVRDGAPAIDLIDGDALIDRLRDLGIGVSEKIMKIYEVNKEWYQKL